MQKSLEYEEFCDLNLERVQLEAENDRLCAEIERLRAEIERLRAALEKYADPNYNGYNGGPEHARAALEGK